MRKLGVPEEHVTELETILKKPEDKKTIKNKIMGWTGKVLSKAAEKGIDIAVPLLMDKLQNLI